MRARAIGCLAAASLLLVGCGGSSSRHSSAGATVTTGKFAQAGSICASFVFHINAALHVGVDRIPPDAGSVLYGELEGLSRRLGSLDAPPPKRAALGRLADALDRAAMTAQVLGGLNIVTTAGRRRFFSRRSELRGELLEVNRLAAGLRLAACQIRVNGERTLRG